MYQKSVLPNGIRIVSETIPYVKSATFGLWLGSGSRAETADNHGISHFIEHLLFKGTKRRSAKEIAESIDAVGGQLNAFTAKEYTCYYIKVIDSQVELAMDILSDMLLKSRFAVNDIEREREVILEELSMYEDTPDELVHDLHVGNIWSDHQLGHNIIGTAQSIKQIDKTAILDYYRQFYTPDNLVIAAAGNITHCQLRELAEKYFAQMAGAKVQQASPLPQFTCTQTVYGKSTEQVHFCLSTAGVAQDTPEIYAYHIYNNLLGGSVSSRLFQSIREERGLAYSVYSYQTNYSDGGLLTVYAGTRPANVEQVLELIVNNISELNRQGVGEQELQRVKEQLKGNLLLGLESSSSRMSRLGKLEISLGKYVSLEEIIAKIDQTTVADINRVMNGAFRTGYCLTTLGPLKKVGATLNF